MLRWLRLNIQKMDKRLAIGSSVFVICGKDKLPVEIILIAGNNVLVGPVSLAQSQWVSIDRIRFRK